MESNSFVKYLVTFNDKMAWISLRLGVAALVLMVITITILIILRYGFSYSPVYSEELSKYLMVLLTFFFAPYAYREGLHSGVNLFVSSWPDKVRHVINFLVHSFIFLTLCYLTKTGIDFFNNGRILFSSTFEVPYSYFYWIVPLSFALMTIVSLELIIVEYRKIVA